MGGRQEGRTTVHHWPVVEVVVVNAQIWRLLGRHRVSTRLLTGGTVTTDEQGEAASSGEKIIGIFN